MSCFKKKEEEVWTRYGVLKGEALSTANGIRLDFMDMVYDGRKDDYSNARRLWANPVEYWDDQQEANAQGQGQELDEESEYEEEEEEVEEEDKAWVRKVRAMQKSKKPGDIVEPIYKTQPNEKRDFNHANYDTNKQLGDQSEQSEPSFYGPVYSEREFDQSDASMDKGAHTEPKERDVDDSDYDLVMDDVDYNGNWAPKAKDEDDWTKVVHIPADPAGWDPEENWLKGDKDVNSKQEPGKAWMKRFADKTFTEYKVESKDRCYIKKYSKEDVNEPLFKERLLSDQDKVKKHGGADVYIRNSDLNKIRCYILTYLDKRQGGPLHVAAANGDKDFTKMLVMEAVQMGVCRDIINLPRSHDNLTPLQLLCEKGFRNNQADSGDQDALDDGAGDDECIGPTRASLVKLMITYGANPNVYTKSVLHTPLHWLAYWGDWQAIRVLLKLNTREKIVLPPNWSYDMYFEKHGAFNLFETADQQTPCDIAGDLGHYRCLKEMIKHFLQEEEQRRIIRAFSKFGSEQTGSRYSQQRTQEILRGKGHKIDRSGFINLREQEITISIASAQKTLNRIAKTYLRVAYWAAFMANQSHEDLLMAKHFVYIFILDLGVSPFVKCYDGRLLISATVPAMRPDLLEELLSHNYIALHESDYEAFRTRLQSKDSIGNNLLHTVCLLPERARERYFRVLNNNPVKMFNRHSEKIVGGFCGCCTEKRKVGHNADDSAMPQEMTGGDLRKRNRLGLQPYELIHKSPMPIGAEIASMEQLDAGDETVQRNKLYQDIAKLRIEEFDADYVLQVKEEKARQLEQLLTQDLNIHEYNEDRHPAVPYLKQSIFIKVDADEEEEDAVPGAMRSEFQRREDKYNRKIFFALKFSPDDIDKWAEERKVWGDIKRYQIKFPFYRTMQDQFASFDARQYFQCVKEHLSKSLDLNLNNSRNDGILIDHFPLHKYQSSLRIKQKLQDTKYRMILYAFPFWQFCSPTRNITRKMESTNILKRYCGEELAFYYLFLNNQIVTFIIPVFISIALWFRAKYNETYATEKPASDDIQIWYGRLLAVYVTLFIEYWKYRERTVIFEWDLEILKKGDSNLIREQYSAIYKYDSDTNLRVKQSIRNTEHGICTPKQQNTLFLLAMLLLNAGAIAVFELSPLLEPFRNRHKPFQASAELLANKSSMPKAFHVVADSLAEDGIYQALSAIDEDFRNPEELTAWDKIGNALLVLLAVLYKFLEEYLPNQEKIPEVIIYVFTIFFRYIWNAFSEPLLNKMNFKFEVEYQDQQIFQQTLFRVQNTFLPLLIYTRSPGSTASIKTIILADMTGTALLRVKQWYASYQREKFRFSAVKQDLETVVGSTKMADRVQMQINYNAAIMTRKFSQRSKQQTQFTDRYVKLAMQYAYVVCFSAICPLASLWALIRNMAELNILMKFMYYTRMDPKLSFGIGSFNRIFEFISNVAIVVVLFIEFMMSFQTDQEDLTYLVARKLGELIVIEHGIFLAKLLIAYAFQQLDTCLVDLKQNTRIDKERHKTRFRVHQEKLRFDRVEAFKHVRNQWKNIFQRYKGPEKPVAEVREGRRINYMYNHTKLPPIEPTEKKLLVVKTKHFSGI